LELEQEVEFLGFVEDMRGFNQYIDIFLMSSNYEGFGYVMIEAMLVGRPVIAFDIQTAHEIIDNGITGFIVEHGDVEDMARKIMLLSRDPDLMTSMSEAGKKKVQACFSLERSIEHLLGILANR
jgi:glycosyltransferase involved in cell wall biosynthesis